MMEKPPTSDKRTRTARPTLTERMAHLEAHPEEVTPRDLNNLHLWVRDAGYRDTLSRGKSFNRPRNDRDDSTTHSELWRQKSHAEFLDALDQAVTELNDPNLDRILAEREALPRRIQELEEQIKGEADKDARILLANEQRALYQQIADLPPKINEALIPLYQHLRKQGYTHYDLVG